MEKTRKGMLNHRTIGDKNVVRLWMEISLKFFFLATLEVPPSCSYFLFVRGVENGDGVLFLGWTVLVWLVSRSQRIVSCFAACKLLFLLEAGLLVCVVGRYVGILHRTPGMYGMCGFWECASCDWRNAGKGNSKWDDLIAPGEGKADWQILSKGRKFSLFFGLCWWCLWVDGRMGAEEV